LLTISHLSYSSYVLRSFPLTKWFLENGANPNLGPDTYRLYSRESAMIPNSGLVLEKATYTNPATAVSLINLLLHHGARLEDSLPLHLAAECGPYEIHDQHYTSTAISHPQVQGDFDIDPTCTPSSSMIPVLKYLLDLGYDPNASDIAHFGPRAHGPPLHWAVRGGSVENARFLLENGADPWGQNPNGLNTLEAAKFEYDPTGEGEMQKVIKEFM
jgi:ankyrin repeat protein